MAGFCEGCPVPAILTAIEDGTSEYRTGTLIEPDDAAIALTALARALAKQGNCDIGPTMDYATEQTDYAHCNHEYSLQLSQLGDVVETSDNYVLLTVSDPVPTKS